MKRLWMLLVIALAWAALVVVRAVASEASPRAVASAASPLAGVTLEDPDGRPWDLDALVGQPVLIVVADRSGSDGAVAWGRALGEARPRSVATWAAPGKVAVVSIADLRGVPSFARGMARWAIDAMVDEHQGEQGPPLLLDWDGTVATRIDARPDTPNLRLYAADGSVVLREHGEATPTALDRLVAAIDELLARASASAGGPSPSAAASPGGATP